MPSHRFSKYGAAALAVLLAGAGRPAAAQPAAPVWAEYAADDELENYLRSLQALGEVAGQPWSLRRFSPVQLDRLRPESATHAWGSRLAADGGRTGGWAIVRPRAQLRYNSTFPQGGNDGAVWAGRGATGVLSLGVAARWRALSVAVNPVAFWAQNQPFGLLDNGLDGPERFGDGLHPRATDRPQRFGDGAYAAIDPGQSTIRVDAYGVALGVSTANLWWGPAQEYPFLLGTNAAGFPHAFVGTSTPANLWIARAHAQLIWGRLEQSDYFVPSGSVQRRRRFATGLALVVTPRGADFLELGAARFFHAPWPDEGMPDRYLTRSFEGLFKSALPEVENPIESDSRSIDGENQLASVFARLRVPGTGFELYGEVGREDHPWDLRHLLISPDEQSSITLGFRKSWQRGDGAIRVLRGERINFQQRQVDRRRLGPAVYLHASGSNQGHTNRGQLLGADVGVGSAGGAIVGVDLFTPQGRTSFEWRRVVRQERITASVDGTRNAGVLDVVHTLGAERVLFRGATDLSAALELSHNFDRDFERDRTNVGVRLSIAGVGR